MELDLEHTMPVPDYLVTRRLSLEEAVKRFSKPRLPDIEKDPRGPPGPPTIGMGVSRGKFIKDPHAPDDKCYFVLITICLFGLVHMIPFMFFSTANEYWMYKFRNVTHPSTDANDRTYLQRYFSSLNSITVTAPGVICNFIAAVGGHKIRATTRVFTVLAIHSTILILQAIFVNIDTDYHQVQFFVFVMICQLAMSCAMSLGGSGSMGLIAKLPPRYMKAQLMGEGVTGVLSSSLRLMGIMITPSVTSAALIYFITGSVMMVVMSIIFYIATKTNFFMYYTRSAREDTRERVRNYRDIWEIVKIMWPMIILPLLGMLIPAGAIFALVVSEYNGVDDTNVWGSKYFVTVCTYMIPAFTGLIGRGLFNGLDIDLSIPVLYIITIIQQAFFGTLIFLCNAKPRYHLPVLLKHDWQYALLVAAQSLMGGFFMNLQMIKSMRMVPPNRIELSMMVTMFCFSVFNAATSPLGVLAVSLL